MLVFVFRTCCHRCFSLDVWMWVMLLVTLSLSGRADSLSVGFESDVYTPIFRVWSGGRYRTEFLHTHTHPFLCIWWPLPVLIPIFWSTGRLPRSLTLSFQLSFAFDESWNSSEIKWRVLSLNGTRRI